MNRSAWIGSGRVPSLDGLRAIAVAGVLVDHVATSGGFPIPDSLMHVTAKGAMGVDLFFVISGFLITLLLLRERERYGAFSLRGFYTRRALRILPAYVAFLVAVGGVAVLGAPGPTPTDWFGLLTYTMNWHAPAEPSQWAVGLTWTLSIEEQFYLLWPLLLLRSGPIRARIVLLLYILAVPALRILVASIAPSFTELPAHSSLTRMDGIAMGCLMALIASDGTLDRLRVTGRRALIVAGAALLLLFISIRLDAISTFYILVLNNTVTALLFAVLIWLAVANSQSFPGRVLSSRLMVAVGTLSYSLYLWQGLYLVPGTLAPQMPGLLAFAQRWPINLVFTFATALVSYLVIELPFLNRKDRVRGAQPHQRLIAPQMPVP
ncbi:MAG TPA: acyltransferase [Candidatus Limnocylindria bacterium]|nr:acyltransferase [Candidatus Limnocylindria bacterium]